MTIKPNLTTILRASLLFLASNQVLAINPTEIEKAFEEECISKHEVKLINNYSGHTSGDFSSLLNKTNKQFNTGDYTISSELTTLINSDLTQIQNYISGMKDRNKGIEAIGKCILKEFPNRIDEVYDEMLDEIGRGVKSCHQLERILSIHYIQNEETKEKGIDMLHELSSELVTIEKYAINNKYATEKIKILKNVIFEDFIIHSTNNCGDVKGYRFTNLNGTIGGFVEITATVDKNNKNIHLAKGVSVCEYAEINDGTLLGKATITGDHVMNAGEVSGTVILSGGINNGAKFTQNSKQTEGIAHPWQEFTGGYKYSGETMFEKVLRYIENKYYNINKSKREIEVFKAPNHTKEEIQAKQYMGGLRQKISDKKKKIAADFESIMEFSKEADNKRGELVNTNTGLINEIKRLETELRSNK
ncbi:MAG: hypothetical protein HRU03_03735 [Nanoarchaeales archaeon]|nr:hypothetical protein [Nanoarchaeales archaeon]